MVAVIRAWLIELVREAIRLEFPMPVMNVCRDVNDWVGKPEKLQRAVVPIIASKPVTEIIDPSFEQLQDESLQELEKYYESIRQL